MILKTKCFKILLLIGLSILLRQFSFAQKEISNFHYSNTGTGYNTGVPLNIPGIPAPNGEISLATLSDSIGNIKFDFCFTDPAGVLLKKGLVYNKNNQIMPGSNLFSNDELSFLSRLPAQKEIPLIERLRPNLDWE